MLIHPWDAAQDEAEWQSWLASIEHFGLLAIPNLEPHAAPFMVPTHFTLAGDELLLHLARPNPVWPHLEAAREVRLALVGDVAYVPSYWRAAEGAPEEQGVPTSYYASVQFVCRPTIVDDADGKAAILQAQLEDVQPEGRHAAMATDAEPYGRMLPGIRGLQLRVLRVEAKFKYDDHKPVEFREHIIDLLDARGRRGDRGAARQQQRRLDTMGDWQAHRQI